MLTSIVDIEWLDDFEAATAEAHRQHKPLLLKPFDQGLYSDEHW